MINIYRTDYEHVAEFVGRALDELEIEVKGRSILLKPNMLGPFKPERGITTHPSFIKEVLTCMKERGAEVIIGDNPGASGYGTNERVARRTGILEVAASSYVNLGSRPVRFTIDSPIIKDVIIPKEVLEVDMVISLPKLKTHAQTIITGAVKNSFGYLIGGDKAKIHTLFPEPVAFSNFLIDIFMIRPPVLTIMDGIIGMDGNGPSAGRTIKPGLLFISDDAFLLDYAVARTMGIEPDRVFSISESMRRGFLKEETIKSLNRLSLDRFRIKDFRKPSTLLARGVTGTIFNRLGYSLFSSPKLSLIKKRCTKCRICLDSCPTGAISMTSKQGFPRIDREICSACYCCHELCPESAWKITGILGRITGASEVFRN